MQLPKRDFLIQSAVRRNVPLLFGIFAIWDGGKTVSGIRVGRGMSEIMAGDPDKLHVIDTEGNRALAYADQFKFQHVPLEPPHGSLDYLAAINSCVAAGAKVIMIDTVTHEHYGIGGYLDTIESAQAELVRRWRMPDTPQSYDKVKFSAINVAATKRKELVRNIEQLGRAGVALIFCFRASEKVRPRKATQPAQPGAAAQPGDGDGKMVEMGYMPDTKESLMFLMTASTLLMPRAKGVPTWKPEKPGEKLMVKVPGYFEGIFHEGEQLGEEHGRAMARWAKGFAAPPSRSSNGEGKPRSERIAECIKFLSGSTAKRTRGGDPVPASTALEVRYARPEIRALYNECDEDERLQLDAKYDELMESFKEREAIEAESRP